MILRKKNLSHLENAIVSMNLSIPFLLIFFIHVLTLSFYFFIFIYLLIFLSCFLPVCRPDGGGGGGGGWVGDGYTFSKNLERNWFFFFFKLC